MKCTLRRFEQRSPLKSEATEPSANGEESNDLSRCQSDDGCLTSIPGGIRLRDNFLFHAPSKHSFTFDQKGHVNIRADCNCSFLAVRPEQERELVVAFEEWKARYWRPMQINEEFASHFRPRSAFRRFLIDVTARFHRHLLRQPKYAHDHGEAVVPAE